jgi:hypothetical protein
MSERRENRVSAKLVWVDRVASNVSRALRTLMMPSAASALLLAGLCAAPVALGQGQAGAAAPAGGATAHGQPSSAAKPQASNPSSSSDSSSSASSSSTSQGAVSAPAEPQMQDQSAPAAESLGEAARRARAQKTKSDPGAPKVYTDDKLSQLSGHGVSVVGDGNSGGGSSSGESSFSNSGENSGANVGANSGGNGGASGGKTDEQYWRGRARAIHDQMAQCDQEISKLQDEIAKYGAVSVDPQSGAMQSIIYVNDRNAKIKQIEERKAGLQGQLEALEDEGRKAGADSGWFR